MIPQIIILIISIAVFVPEIIFVYKLFTQKISEVRIIKLTLRINLFVFIIASFVVGLVILYDVYFINYKSPMPHSEWQKIKWSDFRAIKRPHQTLDGEQNFAFICSDIELNFISNNTLNVCAYFHPCRSYTYSQEEAGKNLMSHELYHFHITEYFARLLREKITKFAPTNNAQIIEDSDKMIEQERAMQYQYDDETYHGYVLGKQKEWQNKIDSCLKSLEKYSNPIIKYN